MKLILLSRLGIVAVPVFEDEVRYIEDHRIVFVPVIKTIVVGGVTMDKLIIIDGHVVPEIDIIPVEHIVRIPVVVKVFQGFVVKRINL